jgi:hypothetical protein
MLRRAFFRLLSWPLGAALLTAGCDPKKAAPASGSAAALAPDAPVDPAFSSCAA